MAAGRVFSFRSKPIEMQFRSARLGKGRLVMQQKDPLSGA
jgi:hypothetical protein